jgi:hypothetical protein
MFELASGFTPLKSMGHRSFERQPEHAETASRYTARYLNTRKNRVTAAFPHLVWPELAAACSVTNAQAPILAPA